MADADLESDVIDLVLEARDRDLGGGFAVHRVLPQARRRHVGPFVFVDHMGPMALPAGEGMDVRPHPHIGLATITYLFDGEFVHRDSLGSNQPIRPGEVNWMIAGRGIQHSERTGAERRASGGRIHGLQTWVALPVPDEETAPRFEHHPQATIPRITRPGAVLDVIAGSAYGARSPAGVLSPTLYVHALLDPGAELPIDDEHAERAIYVVEGEIECAGRVAGVGTMLVLKPVPAVIRARGTARVVLVGGAPLDGERHIWWNFVSSSRDRIERAKADWTERRFGVIPGDEDERIPLPDH